MEKAQERATLRKRVWTLGLAEREQESIPLPSLPKHTPHPQAGYTANEFQSLTSNE